MLSLRLAPWLLVFGLVAGLCLTAYGQKLDFTISGTVIDDSNTPLIGVTVFVPSLGAGTLTDVDGRYELKAAGDAGSYRAEYSYVGFGNETRTFDLAADNATYNFDITLGGDALNLDEVIVTGPSVTSSRKQLGNAVSSINSAQLNNAAPTSVSGALQGKIAGAQITQNSGDPAGGFSVRLRGASTLAGSSEPLYIIDGVRISNQTTNVANPNVDGGAAQSGTNRLVDINPNDIEKIEILKGAAAAAIYGSLATNGVVNITTKKGVSGKPRFSYSSSFNVNELRKRVPFTTFGKQFGSVDQRLYPIAGTNPTTGGLTVGSNFSTDLVDVTRYDYQDDIFQTATGTDQYLAVRGGNENSNYFASANYLYNGGIIRNTDFRRYGARLRFNQTVNDWASFSVGLNYSNSFSNEKPDGNVFWSPINSINITNNIYNISERDENGNLQAVEPTRVNPLSIIDEFDLTQEVNRVITDVKLALFPFEGFSLNFVVGLDAYGQQGNNFMPAYSYSGVNPGFFDDGFASSVSNNFYSINNNVTARYQRQLGENISSTTQAGFENLYNKNQYTLTAGRGLTPFIRTVNGASTILNAQSFFGQRNIFGYYLQQTFGFGDRLFLTAAGRVDGSSAFSVDNQSIFYPKVSASYVVSEEGWWKNSLGAAINTLRLRASWGRSGNLTANGDYDRFNNFSANQFIGLNSINASPELSNPDVKPELQTEVEVGFDVSFANNRIGLEFTYYDQQIKDLLVSRRIAPSRGGTSAFNNIGELENKGIEIGLNANVVRTANFSWDIYGNYSRNRNKIVDLGQEQFQIATVTGAPIFFVNDQPIGVFFGTYQATNADGSILETPDGLRQRERADRDADGQPTGEILRKVIGDPNPDYTFGLGTNLRFGNFGFNFLLDGVQGVDVFDADKRTRQGVGVGDIAERELRGDLPRGWIWSIYPIEEWRISDGSFVKIREVTLNYTIPSLFGQKLNNTVLEISGRNLYSFDNFTSYDPEVNSGGSSNRLRGVNFGTVPIPRTYTFTLRTSF